MIVLLVVGNIHREEQMPGQGCLAQGREGNTRLSCNLGAKRASNNCHFVSLAGHMQDLILFMSKLQYSQIVLIDSGKALIVEDWQHGNFMGLSGTSPRRWKWPISRMPLEYSCCIPLVLLDKCGTLL